MKCSVVIPTRDRATVLDDCLSALARQALPPDAFEVVVVDNGSTDDTAGVAERHRSALDICCVQEPEPGLHAGRHAGLRAARSDILVFADDDIIAEPTWLESIVAAFADPSVMLVGGNNLPLFEQPPPEWLQRWWQQPMRHGRALPYLSILDFGGREFDVDPRYVWGCNFSIRRTALLRAGGFHPDAMPAERLRWRGDGETHVSDWILQAGLRARFHPGASVWHRVPASRMTPAYFAKRGHAQGISDSYADVRRSGRARSPFFLRAARRCRAGLQRARLRFRPMADPVAAALRDTRIATLDGYVDGYDFHQRQVRNDPDLFAWVMKESYL